MAAIPWASRVRDDSGLTARLHPVARSERLGDSWWELAALFGPPALALLLTRLPSIGVSPTAWLGGAIVWTVAFWATAAWAFVGLMTAWKLLWPPLLNRRLARKRVNSGACGACGYSLSGLTPADGLTTCPECGARWRLSAE